MSFLLCLDFSGLLKPKRTCRSLGMLHDRDSSVASWPSMHHRTSVIAFMNTILQCLGTTQDAFHQAIHEHGPSWQACHSSLGQLLLAEKVKPHETLLPSIPIMDTIIAIKSTHILIAVPYEHLLVFQS